jgi:aryl-phospho-beta-D-glucosidase BglC (GH1 family)
MAAITSISLKGFDKMKRLAAAVIIAAIFCGLSALAQTANPPAGKVNDWWHAVYLTQPLNSPDAKKLPLISVSGNRFVDPTGKPVLLRGVNIADPDKIESQGHWNRDFFVKVKATGATVVRIPVHPAAWRGRGARNYLVLLDQAVQWSTDLGMYVDIDWHSIGNLKQGLFQDPMYETSLPETYNFWRTMAARYNGNHTVAFFELFNEPTLFNGKLGSMTWDEWRQINEDMISLIRASNQEAIPLVAGLDWAYDLTPLRDSPIRAERIGYVTHPYPNKRSRPWPPKWEENFGFAADRYPLIATEFGYSSQYGPKEMNAAYGADIINYLESRNISWIVWCFDPEWGPSMISSWEPFELTDEGKFFSDAMHAKAASSQAAEGK